VLQETRTEYSSGVYYIIYCITLYSVGPDAESIPFLSPPPPVLYELVERIYYHYIRPGNNRPYKIFVCACACLGGGGIEIEPIMVGVCLRSVKEKVVVAPLLFNLTPPGSPIPPSRYHTAVL